MMPKPNVPQRPTEPCWVNRKNKWRLERLPMPTGRALLGAAITAQLCAAFIPGMPHTLAAAIGALIAIVVRRWVPTLTVLIYLNATILPVTASISTERADAIMETARAYLPAFGVIVGSAVALRCGAWLYDRSSFELVLPALLRKR
jgi:hypothetical protein